MQDGLHRTLTLFWDGDGYAIYYKKQDSDYTHSLLFTEFAEDPHLSIYLGHAKVTDTYRYLTATPELLGRAADRFELFALASSPQQVLEDRESRADEDSQPSL